MPAVDDSPPTATKGGQRPPERRISANLELGEAKKPGNFPGGKAR